MKLLQIIFDFLIFYITFISPLTSAKNSNEDLSIKRNEMCEPNNKCIMKCCGFGKYINIIIIMKEDGPRQKTTCGYFNDTKEATDFNIDFNQMFVSKADFKSFEVKSEIFRINKTFRMDSIDITDEDMGFHFNVYLNEVDKLNFAVGILLSPYMPTVNQGEVLLETPNAYDRWTHIPNNMYCLDSIIVEDEQNPGIRTLKPGVWTLYQNVTDDASRPLPKIMTAGMLVSCFFLLAVLLVYVALPELQNLCGMILMAYVANLFGAFLLLAVMRLQQHDVAVCEGLTYLIYFFFLASFCWMNVMSYDIWWTFRGYAKARPIHRRGERFKFLMYCFYAFGLPLALTVMLGVLNHVDLRHKPSFVTPKIPSNNCFIDGGEKLLYLYMPMLILILGNWMFFMMTAFNVWRLSRGTAVLDSGAAGTPHAHRSNRRRLMIYLKLSVVMGLNWILEVVSYSYNNEVVWIISDWYNILIGVFIFLIFVCKPKILRKLRKRFTIGKNTKWYPSQEESSKVATSTCDSSITPEAQQALPLVSCNGSDTLQVIVNKI